MNSLQSSRRDDFDSASRKSVTSKHSSVSYKWNHRLRKPIAAHDEDTESYKWDRHLNKPIKIPIRSLEADHEDTASRKSISSKHSYRYNRRLRKPTQLQPYDGLDVVRWDHKTNKPSKTKIFQRSKLSTPAQKEIQSDGASLHDWSTIASDTIPSLPAKPRKFTWDASSSSISPSYTRNSPRSVVTFDVISEEEDMNMDTTSKPNNGRQQPYASRTHNRTRPRSASSNAARKKRVKEMEVKVMLHQISSSASSISSSGRQLQKLERKVEVKQAASASSDIESNIQDKENDNDNGNDNDDDNNNDNEIDAVKMKKLARMDAILAAKDMLLKEQQQLIRELSNQVETMSLKESTRVDVKRSEHAPAPIPDEIIAPLKDHGHGHENLHHANEHDRPTSAISNLGSTVSLSFLRT